MPNDIIEIENIITRDCRRVIHLMGNTPIPNPSDQYGEGKVTVEAGVYHFRVDEPYRGWLDLHAEGWSAPRRFYVYALDGDRVSIAIHNASVAFNNCVGRLPDYAFVRALPAKAERCQDVYDVMLVDAEWMLTDCVAVGGW